MSDITSIVTQNYVNLIRSLTNAGTSSAAQLSNILAQYGLTPTDLYTYVATQQAKDLGLYRFLNADESVRFYGFANPQGLLNPGEFDDVAQGINSNLGQATNAAKSTFTSVISANTALNALDLVLTYGTVKKYTPDTPLQEALAFAAKISPPVQIASVACRLGKAIDGAIYDIGNALGLNPPEELNPDTWSSIISNDTVFGQAFNWLLALDQDGNVTCYTDETSAAYCAKWLDNEGFFSTSGDYSTATYDGDVTSFPQPNVTSVPIANGGSIICQFPAGSYLEYILPNGVYGVLMHGAGTSKYLIFLSESQTNVTMNYYNPSGQFSNSYTYNLSTSGRTYATPSTLFYYYADFRDSGVYDLPMSDISYTGSGSNKAQIVRQVGTIVFDGVIEGPQPAIDGVIDNGGVVPDTSTWDTVDNTLTSLQSQYPDWFADRLQVETVQPDGRTKQYTYIPVAPVSDVNSLGAIDTQAMPATDVLIDPETATLTQLQTIIEALTQTLLKPQEAVNPELSPQPLPNGSNETNPEQPNKNPQDTGTGTANAVPLPTGSASSLWAVYHPSQSQLNAFGAWLWSSDFVVQLKRLFNDPMQAIIGVHKVFAPILTGGSQNIKCGYLDSGVSSPTVSSQYTEVNCGTVNCREYFGNVFDYDPHTRVSIYLPFIGVVPLKVSEVMRASITVTYGVDVITGACLAKVKVDRDGGGAILYSFGGSCACHYPISAGSYAGIISGIVTSAVGVAGGIMSGNPLAAVGGVIAGARQAHTDVQHSGGFTGCAGAMGPKIPYLIITRPQTRVANDVHLYEGKPSNATQFIGDCTGFVRAAEVHFSSQAAFDDEAKEVEALLKSGVLISD